MVFWRASLVLAPAGADQEGQPATHAQHRPLRPPPPPVPDGSRHQHPPPPLTHATVNAWHSDLSGDIFIRLVNDGEVKRNVDAIPPSGQSWFCPCGWLCGSHHHSGSAEWASGLMNGKSSPQQANNLSGCSSFPFLHTAFSAKSFPARSIVHTQGTVSKTSNTPLLLPLFSVFWPAVFTALHPTPPQD